MVATHQTLADRTNFLLVVGTESDNNTRTDVNGRGVCLLVVCHQNLEKTALHAPPSRPPPARPRAKKRYQKWTTGSDSCNMNESVRPRANNTPVRDRRAIRLRRTQVARHISKVKRGDQLSGKTTLPAVTTQQTCCVRNAYCGRLAAVSTHKPAVEHAIATRGRRELAVCLPLCHNVGRGAPNEVGRNEQS